MKLANILILSAAVAFFIIAVHQTITLGFQYSYWIYMVSIILILANRLLARYKQSRKEKTSRLKSGQPKKRKKDQQLNRRAKRYMERMK